ncbi:MAG: hypothetical protein DI529_16055 [Chryseobacterium sp.]|nr:MAG: hypothetical protein DI529_16055 [Chryseobacterium sp.]
MIFMSPRNFRNFKKKPSRNSKRIRDNIAESTIEALLMVIKLLILFIVITIIEMLAITFFLWMKNPK